MPTAHETSEGTAARSLVKPTAECKGAAAEKNAGTKHRAKSSNATAASTNLDSKAPALKSKDTKVSSGAGKVAAATLAALKKTSPLFPPNRRGQGNK
jgi:hypothetical protein